MNREEAWTLLTEYTQKEALIKHALAVEACMMAYARKFGEDVTLWGIVGLLHDFDYERFPTAEEHPYRGNEILKAKGLDDDLCRAIMAHASYTGVPRDSLLAKTLFAVDELAGFIIAVALVRPSKMIADVEVSSVKKKFKDKAFAAAVSRDDIKTGMVDLGVDENEHIQLCLEALKATAPRLGL